MPHSDDLWWPTPPTPAYCLPSATIPAYINAMASNDAPRRCIVTGSSGLVGQRLVSMLVQRGAQQVLALDIVPVPDDIRTIHTNLLGEDVVSNTITYAVGDICDVDALQKVCMETFSTTESGSNTSESLQIDCFFHVAALVGPYHPLPLYDKVNHQGAKNVVSVCQSLHIPKLVITSSPSTRLDGSDVYYLREDQCPEPDSFEQLQEYSRTKALGEQYALSQNSSSLLVCSIAPHQVYGPTDQLFLPKFLETAQNGRLRILGHGRNLISMCHVDNVTHAHILAAKHLVQPEKAPAGRYYFVTDGGAQFMWGAIDYAVSAAGFTPLKEKFNLGTWLLYPVSYVAQAISSVSNSPLKLNPFVVTMCSIHRYFSIANLMRDIEYTPIRSFQEAWPEVVEVIVQRMGLAFKPLELAGIGVEQQQSLENQALPPYHPTSVALYAQSTIPQAAQTAISAAILEAEPIVPVNSSPTLDEEPTPSTGIN